MPKSKTCLLDVNVWLALAYDGHVHHQVAKEWFLHLEPAKAAFCRITQMGFLRLLTDHRVMGGEALSQRHAWNTYEEVASDRRVLFVLEPPEIGAAWKRYTQGSFTGTNVWTDAYLAAVAALGGMTLVTFDRCLARIKDVQALVLGS